jgi:hypothetical protein
MYKTEKTTEGEFSMKKSISFLLALIIFATFMPTSILSVSAASTKKEETAIFSYVDPEKARSITIVKTDKITFWYCKTSLTIETTEWQEGRQISNTYETDVITPFKKTGHTVKQVCEKDKSLRQKEIFPILEKICAYTHIVNNTGKALSEIAYYYAQEYIRYGYDELKSNTEEILFSACKKELGIDTPFYDVISDTTDAIDFCSMIINNIKALLFGIKACGDVATQKDDSKYITALNDHVDSFFDAFHKIT